MATLCVKPLHEDNSSVHNRKTVPKLQLQHSVNSINYKIDLFALRASSLVKALVAIGALAGSASDGIRLRRNNGLPEGPIQVDTYAHVVFSMKVKDHFPATDTVKKKVRARLK